MIAPKSGCMLGLYKDYLPVEAAMGRRLAIHHHFEANFTDGWPYQADLTDANAGVVPMITVEHTDIAGVNTGSYDTALKARAASVKQFAKPLLVRLWHEMNITAMPWSANPVGYITAWKRVVDLFRNAGVTNVEWVWCPNNGTSWAYKQKGWTYLTWYPGDDYVDWVGIDGYNWGDSQPAWSKWETFNQVFSSYEPIYTHFAGRKPVMLGEVATNNTVGDAAVWIKDAAAQLKGPYSGIKAVVWFNTLDGTRPMTWPLGTAAKLDAWVALAKDPFFQASLSNPDPVPAPPPPVPPPSVTVKVTAKQSISTTTGRPNGWQLTIDTSVVVAKLDLVVTDSAGRVVRHCLAGFVPKTTRVTYSWWLRNDSGVLVGPGAYTAVAVAGTASGATPVPVTAPTVQQRVSWFRRLLARVVGWVRRG